MSLRVYAKKSLGLLYWWMDKLSKPTYKKLYPRYLRWLGIKIDTQDRGETWISPTVFFDSARYDFIEIGRDVTISFDAAILVHDYSIVHAARAVGRRDEIKSSLVKPVKIGNNVFIGCKTLILPGTIIEDNCVIGGGSVVKGKLQAGGVYAGNPAKRINDVQDYAMKFLRI